MTTESVICVYVFFWSDIIVYGCDEDVIAWTTF